MQSLHKVKGVGPFIAQALASNGYASAEELAKATASEITIVPGIGVVRAAALITAAKALLAVASEATTDTAATASSPRKTKRSKAKPEKATKKDRAKKDKKNRKKKKVAKKKKLKDEKVKKADKAKVSKHKKKKGKKAKKEITQGRLLLLSPSSSCFARHARFGPPKPREVDSTKS